MKKFASKLGSQLTKTASGYKFSITKEEWLSLGKKAGWTKTASSKSNIKKILKKEAEGYPFGNPPAWAVLKFKDRKNYESFINQIPQILSETSDDAVYIDNGDQGKDTYPHLYLRESRENPGYMDVLLGTAFEKGISFTVHDGERSDFVREHKRGNENELGKVLEHEKEQDMTGQDSETFSDDRELPHRELR